MAKWGEGDPRWLVEERPDATNVNNWHWAEKNASHWSKEKFNDLLIGTKIETDFGKCEIIEISKCEGDAVVNNRKAKLIFFYEWDIHMKWRGALVNSDNEVKGTVQVPNLSEEHEMKDVDVNVLLDSTGPEAEILKDMMRSTGIDIIKDKLSNYLISLKEEFSKGLILPTKDSNDTEAARTEKLNKKNEALDSSGSPVKSSSKASKIETTELKNTESFKCTAEEFYRTMTVKEVLWKKGNVLRRSQTDLPSQEEYIPLNTSQEKYHRCRSPPTPGYYVPGRYFKEKIPPQMKNDGETAYTRRMRNRFGVYSSYDIPDSVVSGNDVMKTMIGEKRIREKKKKIRKEKNVEGEKHRMSSNLHPIEILTID